jgi:type IV secretion system protein TrbJ
MMPHPRIRLLATVTASAFAAGPAAGQMPVYDPQNFAQNVLQAARALQQINNQIQQINNQTQSLINQAKNLVSLPYSLVSTITSQIQRTEQLIAQAQRIAYSVTTIDQAFTTNYKAINLNLSQQQMIGQAQQRWQNSMAGLQDAMRMQATVVGNISTSRSTVTSLGSSSQSASGALQAGQVNNQLLVQISQELADLVALQSAHSRAQSLIAAGQLTDKGQAQAQLAPYYARTTYQPQSVTP